MEVRPLVYRNVVPNRYLISDTGDIWTTSTRKPYKLIPHQNYGYNMVKLAVTDGRTLEFRVHRLVMAVFTHDCDLTVDHLDGNKQNNAIGNLEYVTNRENLRRAGKNGLYRRGSQHFKSVINEDLARKICQLFSEGVNIREAQRVLGISDIHNIDQIMLHILYRENWKHISKDYEWDVDIVRLKVYKKEHLHTIAQLILTGAYTSREIAKKFPQYDEHRLINVIKKMREGKLYIRFMEEAKRSTTIGDQIRDGNGYMFLIPKSKSPLGASAPKR